jgi:hypothetical protein
VCSLDIIDQMAANTQHGDGLIQKWKLTTGWAVLDAKEMIRLGGE